jgi:imidazolonepropionase-like amidohydrolase
MRLLIENANVFDTETLSFRGETPLVCEDDRIIAVGETTATADRVIDARGRFALPGFIDAHVHFRLATLNFARLARWSEVEFGIVMARLSRETLDRGFTTVRDLGGDVTGLIRAIRAGDAEGPRIVRAGRMLSQTGGHGDVDSDTRTVPACACQMPHSAFGIVADGVDAVRKASRHLLKEGSDFLKIHVSGGVATPTDPLESIQYTPEEIATVVTEARHRGTYVAAHAYLPEAIRMAVAQGVRSIEHGNLLDEDSAKAIAAHDAIMVPTLATYEAMEAFGPSLGLPPQNLEKNRRVLDAGLTSLEIARAANVTLGFGTDLIGETQSRQNREFAIRAEVEPAIDILRSMYQVNPVLCRMEGAIGTLSAGAFADIVLSRVDPLEGISELASPNTALEHVIKAGTVVWSNPG